MPELPSLDEAINEYEAILICETMPRMSREQLLRLYASGKRDFARAWLDGVNLDGLCLTTVNLTHACLQSVSLRRVDLSGASLSPISLRNLDLSDSIALTLSTARDSNLWLIVKVH